MAQGLVLFTHSSVMIVLYLQEFCFCFTHLLFTDGSAFLDNAQKTKKKRTKIHAATCKTPRGTVTLVGTVTKAFYAHSVQSPTLRTWVSLLGPVCTWQSGGMGRLIDYDMV